MSIAATARVIAAGRKFMESSYTNSMDYFKSHGKETFGLDASRNLDTGLVTAMNQELDVPDTKIVFSRSVPGLNEMYGTLEKLVKSG